MSSIQLVLIPKKEEAVQVGDFRPISLVHSFTKIITKILANQLAAWLSEFIAPNQSAFIRGRLHDNFLLVQHVAQSLHRLKLQRGIVKLDITKAFDSISWAFLLEVITGLGFGFRWRTVISNLLASSTMRFYSMENQGILSPIALDSVRENPLSPMLFIMAMDVLTSLVDKADELKVLALVFPRQEGRRIFMYADDVVLFASPDTQNLQVVTKFLA